MTPFSMWLSNPKEIAKWKTFVAKVLLETNSKKAPQ